MTLLKLDLDGKNGLDDFFSRIWIMKGFGLNPAHVSVYETTNGFHVYLCMKVELSPIELLFIQTCLGSDYRKELFGFLRYKRGYSDPSDWNVLFEQKNKVVTTGIEVIKSQETYREDLSVMVANRIESGIRRLEKTIEWMECDGILSDEIEKSQGLGDTRGPFEQEIQTNSGD